MKTNRLFLILAVAAHTCVAMAQDCMHNETRERLLERLAAMQQKGFAFGHQDDTFYGVEWKWQNDRSDVKEVCGDYPAIMGFELGGIELGMTCNLDSVPFDMMKRELQAHIRRGGIATISWHPNNPLTSGNAWDVKDSTVVASVLPGGCRHRMFLLWMDRLADFLSQLSHVEYTDDTGKRCEKTLSFIFRPWHENNGSWFWWGEELCSAEQYHALWCMTQDYLLHKGLTNIVWAYSPNLDGSITEGKFLERYPGDERVDIIGLDAYQWGTRNDFVRDTAGNLQLLSGIAQKHAKLFALTECGLQSVPDSNWWTETLMPLITQHPMCYFLTWRNGNAKERYAPFRGSCDEKDFRRFYKDKRIMLLKDITEI